MFKFVVLMALLGFSLAAPQKYEDEPYVTRQASQVNPDGTYGHEYELSNGVAVQESGIGGQYATGGFQHISPEGETIQLAYTADETGFHPQGTHLPTPPPIPEEILRAIEYIQEHPTPEEQADREYRLQHNQ
ncbi:pupal cuticle protein Edg-78E-like [Eupeodes corollae]|uniref:pupal cuticle protein Edg-78E-like n=1 Tax=Eupeodes corollae TaxID=290404 RepID=UPI002490DC8B|nr:pupal cuticle protein Edg-78E-like [Eupeodes corollae]